MCLIYYNTREGRGRGRGFLPLQLVLQSLEGGPGGGGWGLGTVYIIGLFQLPGVEGVVLSFFCIKGALDS